jgi:uncharacterized protein YcgL (UPF0745 family)
MARNGKADELSAFAAQPKSRATLLALCPIVHFLPANLSIPYDFFAGTAMHCFVYASQRKADTYLWLDRKDNFDVLPASLALLLGDLRFVLEVALHPERRLPHEDVEVVMQHLRTQGWHLQLPPQETLSVPAAKQDPILEPKRQDE